MIQHPEIIPFPTTEVPGPQHFMAVFQVSDVDQEQR
jgi:hypothetical protein